MKKIELYCGTTIDEAFEKLKEESKIINDVCFTVFNGKEILSTDNIDDAYKKITGNTKQEFDEYVRQWKDNFERKEKLHQEKIPQLTDEYRKRARGLVVEESLEFWDKIVPIRLGDLYHGMELEETLKACECMRDESLTYDDRLRKAYDMFMAAGHSGMSASLTASMYRKFVPNGDDLAEAVMNFRFEKKSDQ